MRGRVRVHPGSAVSRGPEALERVTTLIASRVLAGEEAALQPRDQILDRATFPFRGADHSANASGLCLLTAALISLKGRAVSSQISVELITLGQQHRPEMFSLKAIRGLGHLIARVHIAR